MRTETSRNCDIDSDTRQMEIAESTVTSSLHDSVTTLRALCAIGIRLTVDDFGSGNGSLNNLRRSKTSRVKIERTFLLDHTNDADPSTFARNLVSLITELGLDVVLSGVETTQQQNELAEMGCTLIQGFLHSPPVPADQIPDLFATITQRRKPTVSVGVDHLPAAT